MLVCAKCAKFRSEGRRWAGQGEGRIGPGELCDNVYVVSIVSILYIYTVSIVSILNTRGSREISPTEETRDHHFALEAETPIY